MPWESLVLLTLLASGLITIIGVVVAELRDSGSTQPPRAVFRLELSTGSSYPAAARPARGRHRADVIEPQR
ncbi:MAG: hypothetical protein JWN03_8567 [Nocardia sp.]|uniref:hypothetical protein n=1 Tax=Nocardia sp. TaxID=1821 RepID=UPI00262E6424|nr:hypothetical protein [Nocardia sp.]MCU1648292.1 hypothetical protein [Nocardia sp.]